MEKGKKRSKKTEPQETRKMWDPISEQVVDVDDGGFYHNEAYIKTGAGQKDGMPRHYLVLIPKNPITKPEITIAQIETAAKAIACLEFEHAVEPEFFEAHGTYLLASVLIDPEVIPLDFIELLIGMCREVGIELHQDHFVTNIEKPTEEQVRKFLGKANLK